MSLGALCMMLTLAKNEKQMIEVITTVLPCLCIAVVVGITVLFDFGLKQKMCGSKKLATTKDSQASLTQVQPIQSTNRGHNDDTIGELASLNSWGHEERTQRRIDIAQKTTAATTTAVAVTKEMPKIVPKEKNKNK